MNKFTKREKVLISVLALLVLGLGYLKLVLEPINNKIAEYTTNVENELVEIEANAALVARTHQMEEELAVLKADKNAKKIPNYNNSKAVMLELNEILSAASSCSLDFSPVTANGYIMERPVSIAFDIVGYDAARALINRFDASNNINQVSNLSMNMGSGYGGNVSVNVTVTYFEVNTENS